MSFLDYFIYLKAHRTNQRVFLVENPWVMQLKQYFLFNDVSVDIHSLLLSYNNNTLTNLSLENLPVGPQIRKKMT